MGGIWHLTKRFFGAIRPGAPSAEDDAWARTHLLPGEEAIWDRMNNPDRRHSVAVARATVEQLDRRGLTPPGAGTASVAGAAPDRDAAAADGLGDGSWRPVIAAALLHDSGKVISGLRTPARVAATVLWAVADDGLTDRWLGAPDRSIRARLAQYRRHPELGAEQLEAAGADRLTSAWARDHHRPAGQWSVPAAVGEVLRDCDDD